MSGSTSRNTRRNGSGEAEAMARVVERLRQQFPEVPPDALEAVVNGHYEAFDGRPVRDFVPVLVERATRADLEVDALPPQLELPRGSEPGSVCWDAVSIHVSLTETRPRLTKSRARRRPRH